MATTSGTPHRLFVLKLPMKFGFGDKFISSEFDTELKTSLGGQKATIINHSCILDSNGDLIVYYLVL